MDSIRKYILIETFFQTASFKNWKIRVLKNRFEIETEYFRVISNGFRWVKKKNKMDACYVVTNCFWPQFQILTFQCCLLTCRRASEKWKWRENKITKLFLWPGQKSIWNWTSKNILDRQQYIHFRTSQVLNHFSLLCMSV